MFVNISNLLIILISKITSSALNNSQHNQLDSLVSVIFNLRYNNYHSQMQCFWSKPSTPSKPSIRSFSFSAPRPGLRSLTSFTGLN